MQCRLKYGTISRSDVAESDFFVHSGALETDPILHSHIFQDGIEFDNKLLILHTLASLVVADPCSSLDCSDASVAEISVVPELRSYTLSQRFKFIYYFCTV